MAHRWFAVSTEFFDHPIVGIQARVPAPAEKGRPAAAPGLIWLWICANAAHKPHEVPVRGFGINSVIELQRGQLVLAHRRLANLANWTHKAVREFYGRLETAGMIRVDTGAQRCDQNGQLNFAIESTPRGTREGHKGLCVLTICNYDKYQLPPRSEGHKGSTPRGTRRGTDSTRDTVDTDSSRSPLPLESSLDAREEFEVPSGTDGDPGERLPFTETALAACEAMGFTRQTIVERYYTRTKGKPIRDPSAYLIEMAIDMAAKVRGVPKDAVRASISNNTEERAEGYRQATCAPPELSASMYAALERRCKRAGHSVEAMLGAWGERVAGVRVLNADANADAFCSTWLRQQQQDSENRA